MRKTLLLLLAVTSTCFSLPALENLRENNFIHAVHQVFNKASALVTAEYEYAQISSKPLDDIKEMLQSEAPGLSTGVINKVLTSLSCASEFNVEHNNILTIIDYSLPSSEKRLWIFDIKQKKLLFNTYVSHGIKSGARLTKYFSNKYDSKASSIGVYKTEKTYYGRDGLSLRLSGLDKGFNDNASNRYVVMHGGWYVAENFIKKYGRAGRSWGCPAIPENLTAPIINTIKDQSFFVIYYPSDNWFSKSKFLNCNKLDAAASAKNIRMVDPTALNGNEQRSEIVFADLNKDNKREENESIIVMSADNYQQVFNTKAPLNRMLRRQINNVEYIALNNAEFEKMIPHINSGKNTVNPVYFIIPVIKMNRGYYATEMHMVNMGKIQEVRLNNDSSPQSGKINNYTVYFENKPFVNLRATNQFIRWLGL